MKNTIKFGLCSAVALAFASSVYATPSNGVRFSTDGINWTTTVIDEGAGDLGSGIPGFINTTPITVGNFHVVVTTSFTYPIAGSLNSPILEMHVTGITVGAGDLWVEFSSSGYTTPAGSTLITSAINNQPGVTQTEVTRIGANNTDTLFDPAGTTFSTIGPLTSGTAGTSSGAVPGGVTPFVITIQDHFTADAAGRTLSSDDLVRVPDGGNTLMLLGSALSVLGLGVFRKSRKA